jgi:hypothetical protein
MIINYLWQCSVVAMIADPKSTTIKLCLLSTLLIVFPIGNTIVPFRPIQSTHTYIHQAQTDEIPIDLLTTAYRRATWSL